MSTERFGIVVVHWRGMNDTLACLRSLAELECGADARIAVMVNGPGDFDEVAARGACDRIEVVTSPTNLGYGGGCNLGAAHLTADGSIEYLLFLNNDVTLAPAMLTQVAAAFESREEAGVAGAIVVYDDDPSRIWFAGGYVNTTFGYTRHHGFRSRELPQRGFRSRQMPGGEGEARAVDFVNGSAIAVRADLFKTLGGFDERYFHYFEDTDLSARAGTCGFESLVIPEPLVRHRVSASAGVAGSNRLNRLQAYYFARNRMRFVRRNIKGWRRITATASQVALLLPYEAVKAVIAGNPSEARGRFEGAIAGVLGRAGPRT